MDNKVDRAVSMFMSTHNKRNRNDQPHLQAVVNSLDAEQFKEYMKRTEKWAATREVRELI